MERSSVMRRSATTLVERSRLSRRRAPFVLVLALAVLSWVAVAVLWFALNAWLT